MKFEYAKLTIISVSHPQKICYLMNQGGIVEDMSITCEYTEIPYLEALQVIPPDVTRTAAKQKLINRHVRAVHLELVTPSGPVPNRLPHNVGGNRINGGTESRRSFRIVLIILTSGIVK